MVSLQGENISGGFTGEHGFEQPHDFPQKTANLTTGGAQSGALAQILALLPGLTPEERSVLRHHLDGIPPAS